MKPLPAIRNFAIMMDDDFSVTSHVNEIVRQCHYSLLKIKQTNKFTAWCQLTLPPSLSQASSVLESTTAIISLQVNQPVRSIVSGACLRPHYLVRMNIRPHHTYLVKLSTLAADNPTITLKLFATAYKHYAPCVCSMYRRAVEQ